MEERGGCVALVDPESSTNWRSQKTSGASDVHTVLCANGRSSVTWVDRDGSPALV